MSKIYDALQYLEAQRQAITSGETPAAVINPLDAQEGPTPAARPSAHPLLEQATADMDLTHVVKTTIFMKDMNDFGAMNEVYGSFFSGNFPARETVQVAGLPKGVNVEISMTAIK